MDLFAKAKGVKGAAAPKKKGDKTEIEVEGLEQYAEVVSAEKTLGTLKEDLRKAVVKRMMDYFVAEGMKLGRRPESCRGTEGTASASLELRSRSTASALTEMEIQTLKEAGVSTQEVSDVAETFRINPAYKDDQDMLAKVSEALSGVEGLPEDFIQLQEANKKVVVTPTSLDEVFAKGRTKAQIEQLLPMVSVNGIKPKIDDEDTERVFNDILKLITGE